MVTALACNATKNTQVALGKNQVKMRHYDIFVESEKMWRAILEHALTCSCEDITCYYGFYTKSPSLLINNGCHKGSKACITFHTLPRRAMAVTLVLGEDGVSWSSLF